MVAKISSHKDDHYRSMLYSFCKILQSRTDIANNVFDDCELFIKRDNLMKIQSTVC